MDDIMALCKRRGFVYQASEIYGGINGFWDYGPLGTLLKKNLRDAWWEDVVMLPCWGRKGPDGEPVEVLPVDTRLIQNPKVWEASGHVAGFNDPMVDCKECKARFRADHVYGTGLFNTEIILKMFDFPTPLSAENSAALSSELTSILAAPYSDDTKARLKALEPLLEATKRPEQVNIPVVAAVGASPQEALDSIRVFVQKAKMLRQLQPGRLYPLSSWPAFLPPCPCPNCQKRGTLTPPRQFNLMFKTYVGATAGADDIAYLRPETAQGIFVQFKNVVDTNRVRIPFGIAQTGTAFRNEVTPRNFTFRSREFEQMEIEFFCHESQAMDWYAFWRDWRMEWWKSIGLGGDNLILREHAADELAHYSKATSDIEYRFPFTAPGFGELEGVAYRGNFDLTQHQKHSGAKLEYFDTSRGEPAPNGQPKGERYLPHVIEPSAGLDRGVLALLCEAYTKDPARPSPEFMKFHPRVAPIKAAVFPLVNKDGMPEVAERLHADLVKKFGRTGLIETDPKQSIGKRYARMDEAGCPFCFTIDGDTLKDQTVTVRDRDTGAQERIALDKVSAFLSDRLGT